MLFFTTTRPSLPKEGTKKDMSIKDWFKGSCSKAGALNRSWTIEADRLAY